MAMGKRKLVMSIISLVLSAVLALGGGYAWFASSKQPETNVDLTIVDLENEAGNVIDISGETGQSNDPFVLYPGETNFSTAKITNKTQTWIKITLTVSEVGILYGGIPSNIVKLADPWYVDALGAKQTPYVDTDLLPEDFVCPVTNALQLVAYAADDAPTSYLGFDYITAAALATATQKANTEFNLLPSESFVGGNVYCSETRAFLIEGIPYAYITTDGEIFVRNSAAVDMVIALHYCPSQTASVTLEGGNVVTEFSSNPFINQHFNIKVYTTVVAIEDDSLLPVV